jgi:PAS domain-containing protein
VEGSRGPSTGSLTGPQRPLELILARNLLSSISTPAFLVDGDGVLVFYNDAAGGLLGKAFEEAGSMSPEEWGKTFGPFDEGGTPIPFEELPITRALRAGRPVHGKVQVQSTTGDRHWIELSALPIVGTESFRGAMAIFWPIDENGTGEGR